MVKNYTAEAELMGQVQAIPALIAAGLSAAGTVAAIVATRMQQKRAGKQATTQQQHEIRLAELQAKAKAAASGNMGMIAALAGIPVLILLMKSKKKGKK